MNEHNSFLIKNLSSNNNEDDEDDEEDEDYRPSGEESEDKGDLSEDEESENDQNEDDLNSKRKVGKKMSKKQRNQKRAKQENEISSGDDYDENDLNERETKVVDEIEIKKKSDDLWTDLLSSTSKPSNPQKSETHLVKGTLEEISNPDKQEKTKIVVTKVFEYAGEEVKVNEEIDADYVEAKNVTKNVETNNSNDSTNSSNSSTNKPSTVTAVPTMVKRTGGLGNLLSNLSKKPKLSTLTKTQLDWKSFKQSEGLEEELQQHVKSKDGFIERQAFLQRADLRQFELEKQIRERNRISKS